MSGRGTRWTAAALATATLALTGCLRPTGSANCLDAGLCECIEKTDCALGLDCIDGRCGYLPDAGDLFGKFGMKCVGAGDCDSGLCLPNGPGNGQVCTEACVGGAPCPLNWQCKTAAPDAGPARVCVPPLDTLCQRCALDSDCNAAGDLCLSLDAGRTCGRDCSLDPCPAGYQCQAQGATKQCFPAGATCECTAVSVGLTRGCDTANDAGHCFGHHTCQGDGTWSGCDARVPSREVCDGVDNDCNGLVDTDDPGLDVSALPASPAYPHCAKGDAGVCSGVWTCHEGADASVGWDCSAPTPRLEECNGRDDDCNGQIDESFLTDAGQYATLHACGACGYDCETAVENLPGGDAGVPAGAVACELRGNAPTCVPKACAPGFYLYPPANPVLCMKSVSSACRPCTADPDCQVASDKCVAIGTDPGTYCAQGCAASAPYPGCTGAVGQQGCCPGGYTCQNVSGAKLCMPFGNSCACNPTRVGATRACFVGTGALTCSGLETCADGGAWSACSTKTTTTELCDTLDNNCNGLVDEPFVNTRDSGTYDTDLHCGNCETSCVAMWSPTIQHANGGCVAGPAVLPNCQIVSCTQEAVPGGGLCQLDSDCTGGRTCHPLYHQCVRACGTAADCFGNPCVNGTCTAACTSDAGCAALGSASSCQGGVCKVSYQFVNADKDSTNGCECPAAVGVVDVPDLYPVYPDAGWPYVDRDCDLVDGVAATSLFVRAGSATSLGTRANPYRSLGEAITAFNPAVHSAILVAAGSYVEMVGLRNGVKIYGGYSPDFSQRDVVAYPTLVEGPEPVFTSTGYRRGTVNAENITAPTVFAGFTVRGYDVAYRPPPGNPGKNSYAIYVKDSTAALVLANNHVVGGRGGDASPGPAGSAGQSGGNGANGLNTKECLTASCAAETQNGGSAGLNSACPGSTAGHSGAAAAGNLNSQGYSTAANGDGLGGDNAIYQHSAPSQNNLCKYDCTVPATTMNGGSAVNGGDGVARTPGGGCANAGGMMVGDEWVGGGGTNGTSGTHSLGGGGGGAGGCVINQIGPGCTVGNRVGDLGATGGGGGAGGCGGTAGLGGSGGGGSFGIFIAFSNVPASYPTLTGNLIETGAGGFGGNGGPGGYGGLGGAGGEGGVTVLPAWCAGGGGHGGRGGNGGAGSGGGGGCGGVAYGLAGTGIGPAGYAAKNSFAAVAPSSGGGAGAGGASPAGAPFAGGGGASGVAATNTSF